MKPRLFNRTAQLADRLVDIGQVHPGDAEEALAAGDIFGDGVVIGARHGDAEITIDFVDQRPVVGDDDLVVEALAHHDIVVHIEIPTGLAERMNFLTVAKIGRRVAGKIDAETAHRARAFLEFDMAAPRMIDLVDETHRPVMGIAVNIHAHTSWEFYSDLG